VDPDRFNRFVRFNTAGLWDNDSKGPRGALWLWNLACEGTTVDADLEWLPWLDNLRPERIFIHRGSLESIVRPGALRSGLWPWWVPLSWRGYAAMDPRCYFSAAPWRRLKQGAVDRLKQRVRVHLLAKDPPAPLMTVTEIHERLSSFLAQISSMAGEVFVIGLLPVGDDTFPGSASQFEAVNYVLARLANEFGAHFLDPSSSRGQRFDNPAFYYSDRFHPNLFGAREIAAFICSSMTFPTTSCTQQSIHPRPLTSAQA
jgi:hypothetical protein